MTDQIIDGRYRVFNKLGEGAMGVVYKGEVIEDGMPVAIKALKPQVIVENPLRLERFIREAEALYQLQHPHIVKVLDTVRFNDVYFIIMEYMAGGSLRARLEAEKKLDIRLAVEIALDLSDALIRTHRMRIVHRDVKPDNVLLDENGVARLTDFGAAHITDAETLTMHGAFIGTIHYMAPEILLGQEIDPRADIWSFGVLMYEMLTGFRPFMASTLKDLIMAIIRQPVPNIDKLCTQCPENLVDLVNGMLQKKRDERIGSMRQVGLLLEEVLDTLG
jgi:eukaryotic-like serine/threonine-protein kinase